MAHPIAGSGFLDRRSAARRGRSRAQSAGPPSTTPLLVATYRLKPEMVEQWQALLKEQVLPALRKAGVTSTRSIETVLGDSREYTSGPAARRLRRIRRS